VSSLGSLFEQVASLANSLTFCVAYQSISSWPENERRKLTGIVLPAAYGSSAIGNAVQQEEEDKLFMATAIEEARKVSQPCKSHSLPSVWMHGTLSTCYMQLVTSATKY
jgi:hypothetical protein